MVDMKEFPNARLGYGIFKLPKSHPFTPMAIMHDAAYQAYKDGFRGRPLCEVDDAFLRGCLEIAKREKSLSLRTQAYVFYGLITAFRVLFR